MVIDLLEVGPAVVEPTRIKTPYRILSGDEEDVFNLIYSYEEHVFDPDDPADLNLASMITAQVALNYGLFCKEIVFHGVFDQTDQKLIRDMTENTSREIYIVKILQENPFLKRDTANFSFEKRSSYTQAGIHFIPDAGLSGKVQWKFWHTDKLKHCILSSGGKDSLLSYGLMNETGKETHPVFVNESGRHWFTALNAYRYFKENIPNTARVWTNSDRLFTRMLRHMPFIRKDFNNIRSDDYPIRLWTVAVFLFGVLPIMKKRGIGRLIIGDEYDSTSRGSYMGMTHYNGLYDQSRYFDENLSRYFLKKGWAVTQFSILRPLSELLIEKILAHRYPHLLKHQVSCHASHQKDNRIYPCGKCEKCRRIIGMLTALDVDPGICGYTETRIKESLTMLGKKRIKQLKSDARQLYYMLHQKGLFELTGDMKSAPRPHPGTMKLRFDSERSLLKSIPTDLRKRLYRIYLEYSDGAIKRTGRRWKEFNPPDDPDINELYPFEMDPDVKENFARESSDPSNIYMWGELTWPDAEKRFRKTDIALLPVGSIEQHGPHLPLDTDSFDADYLARRVAEACSEPKPLVLPLLPYGVSYHHDDFPGTISVSNDALANMVYDIGMALARNGIKKLVIINGHGDNAPTLRYAAQMINRDARIFTCVDTGETSDVDIDRISETANDVHAGEAETSTSLATRPNLVKMERAKTSIPEFSTRYLNFSSKRGVPWYAYTKRISETGIMGDPSKATAEKGEKMWEIMIAHLVSFIEDLKGTSLEEIYQKKY